MTGEATSRLPFPPSRICPQVNCDLSPSLFYAMKDWACECAVLFSLAITWGVHMSWFRDGWSGVYRLWIVSVCQEGRVFFCLFFFFNVFCKLFSLSTFCYYPVYISLIYHFLKENSNNFKFTFQFQHQMRKIRDEQLYPAWVIFVRFSCMNFNNTFTFCNLIIQKCFQ